MSTFDDQAPSLSSGTELQHRTREERGFHETESSLPYTNANEHTAKMSPPDSPTRPTITSRISDALSRLTSGSPAALPVTDQDEVWLLDNVAFRGPTGEWQAEFVAAVFKQKPSASIVDAVGDISEKVGLSRGDEQEAIIERRITPFLLDIRPKREVRGIHGEVIVLQMGPGGNNGISSDLKNLPSSTEGNVVTTVAQVPEGTTGLLEMQTHFVEPEGWGVISDIDDTIKVTMTSDPIGILRSTFVSEPTPITGMPELYAYIQSLIGPAAPFFYLSASPYNLYSFLREFRNTYYPRGQMILRDQSFLSVAGLLSNLTLNTQSYKSDRMRKVNAWIPGRKMICIGDSTQSDPEAYGETYRAFPGWVRVILIRKVTDIASVGIEEKNAPERFEKAFAGVPKDVWHVFEDPAECYRIIENAVGSEE